MQKKLAVTAAKGWLSEQFGCKLPCLGMFGVCLNYSTGGKMVMNTLLTWSSNRLSIANPEWKIIFCSYLHLSKTLMATARIRNWVGRQVYLYNILELLLLGSKVSLDQLSSDSVSCWNCDPRRPLCEQAVGPPLTFALEDGMNLTLTAKVSWHRLAVVSSFLLCLFFHVLSTLVKHQQVILCNSWCLEVALLWKSCNCDLKHHVFLFCRALQDVCVSCVVDQYFQWKTSGQTSGVFCFGRSKLRSPVASLGHWGEAQCWNTSLGNGSEGRLRGWTWNIPKLGVYLGGLEMKGFQIKHLVKVEWVQNNLENPNSMTLIEAGETILIFPPILLEKKDQFLPSF